MAMLCTDAGSLDTVAVGVTACTVTPSAGSGSLPSRSHPRLPDDVAANSMLPGVMLRSAPFWNLSLGVPGWPIRSKISHPSPTSSILLMGAVCVWSPVGRLRLSSPSGRRRRGSWGRAGCGQAEPCTFQSGAGR